MTATTSTANRTPSSDAIPLQPVDGPQAFTLSRRTLSGLEHEISALVQELELLGIDLVSPKRKDHAQGE